MDSNSEKRSLSFSSFSYILFFITNLSGSLAAASSQDSLAQGPTQQAPRLTVTPSGEIYKAKGVSVQLCSEWSNGAYYSESDDGCIKRKSPECRETNGNGGFSTEIRVMSTEGFKFEYSENLTLHHCAAKCWYNCSCLAFASTNDTYGTGCEIWTEVPSFSETHENLVARNIYFYRNESYQEPETRGKWWISLVVIGILIALPIFCYVCCVIWKRCKAEVEKIIKRTMLIREIGGRTVVSFLYDIANTRSKAHMTDNEIQIFSFRSVAAATKKFSTENKLGEGGFGSVYKTDVFSFGVLVLEIVSGKKNNSRHHSDHPLNLIGLAWQHWRDDKAMEIIDPSLLECCPSHEALRCVQVGLLCVQDRAADRPSMLEVVSMLSNETTSLPTPKQPAFYIDVEESESNGSEEQPKTYSINEVTISGMDAR
ncbi:hypothetical protein L6164_026087 [Bauhinia variegata]|uniref:Uncharacterized protein n=1 Tax=Bauhinia variegata TaxID=167791 RepID=A0ACB9M3M1_BAUVA|nr:hypothetical protein L6164_026087 [Bauhinia variegata]